MDFQSMVGIIVVLCFLDAVIGVAFAATTRDFSMFNPIRNYEEWESMNWFGVGVTTLLLNIIFIPCALLYWMFKIIEIICICVYYIFTVGRE